MDSDRWQEIKQILDHLSDATPEVRRQVLDRLQETDEELRIEVESYLPYEKTDCFIDQPVWELLSEDQAPADVSTSSIVGSAGDSRIGPYRLLNLLGRGGMGQVHLAVREDDYEQKVAIKRTLGPLAQGEMHARFTNERQILADLQHPGIARLLDGGTDADGLPYLVMEYVEGEPITTYCRHHQLNLRQRLRLFRKVCQAVHFAHQNLIVHRDLKPGNILVTEDGKPRLLDFGIAKLLEASQDNEVTTEGKVPLTPACASPEQLMGDAITTATDIYALGLLLYELLTDRKAYEVNGLGMAAMIRQVCLREPPKPSQAVGKDPANDEELPTESTWYGPAPTAQTAEEKTEDQQAERLLKRRRRQLRGDLDSIVMKAIRKEPAHRYLSAADLADDVLNYLDGLPVQARRGNWLYHTGKFLSRNRPALVVLLLIIALAVTSTAMWHRAEQMRERAVDREAEAIAARDFSDALSKFLTKVLTSADPNKSRGQDLTVKELVEHGREDIEIALDGKPDIQAEMYAIFGEVYYNLGARNDSFTMKKRALEKYRVSHPEAVDQDHAIHIANYGKGFYGIEDYRSAERYFEQSIRMRHSLGIPTQDYLITIRNLASSRLKQGKYDLAEEGYVQVLDILSKNPDSSATRLAMAHHALGTFYKDIGDFERAVVSLRMALELHQQTPDPLSTQVASTRTALGESYLALDQPDLALDHLSKSLEIYLQRVPGTKNEARSHRLLALAYLQAGELERAQAKIDRSREILTKLYSQDHWLIAANQVVQADLWLRQGDFQRAELQLLESLEVLRGHPKPIGSHIRFTLKTLIRLYEHVGNEEAARKYRAALEAVQSPGAAVNRPEQIDPDEGPYPGDLHRFPARAGKLDP